MMSEEQIKQRMSYEEYLEKRWKELTEDTDGKYENKEDLNPMKKAVEYLAMGYIIPTTARRFIEKQESRGIRNPASGTQTKGLEILSSLMFSMLSPILAYTNTEDWRYMLIPVITNVGSGVYELYRSSKKNLEGGLK